MPVTVYPANNEIRYQDSPNLDAFSRLRVSNSHGIYDAKQIHTNLDDEIETVIAGSGTSTYQYNRSSSYLSVTTASGDSVIRQSVRYFGYVPGKSQMIVMTGVFGAGKTNVSQYIGYGDDLNGLFFKLQDTTFGVVVRTATSGAAVDAFTAQSSFNIDKLDGTGPSGITLDITKTHIFIIDFQWLGVGRIRFSLDIDGVIVPVHEVLNANVLSLVYMKTPSLPVRYQITNTGATASATTLEQICYSVNSEGGYSIPGIELSAGNGITARAVTARTPIFAIRMKAAFPTGQPNRKTARFLSGTAIATTNNALVELAHCHAPSGITATWTSAGASSGVEYSTDISAITGNPEHVVTSGQVVAGLGASAGSVQYDSTFINTHSFISQDFTSANSQVFVVYATPFTGTSNVAAQISWVEFD